ncbi:MAG TPA: MtnX-like HAD-IB family phosphatase [Ignavibacteria bacterium]|nr:MtnX-like HAD-IB family phosphatase [Ignavibacteria bacterium]
MKKYSLKIYCDFDGTITKNDVWINTIGSFIKDKEKFNIICDDFYSQKIGTRECNKRQLELVEDFSIEKFNEVIGREEIDDHFKDFVSFCKESDIEIIVVSGGLDHYIRQILKREKLDLKFYSCKMIWNEEQKELSCGFIYTDEYCRSCETCKRNILINNTNDLENEISVYIGDGVSDYCVSGFADIVFAKGRLASYCWKNNITYFDYKDFSDIKNKIMKLISQNKVKQRQEAKVRRKDIFLGG